MLMISRSEDEAILAHIKYYRVLPWKIFFRGTHIMLGTGRCSWFNEESAKQAFKNHVTKSGLFRRIFYIRNGHSDYSKEELNAFINGLIKSGELQFRNIP